MNILKYILTIILISVTINGAAQSTIEIDVPKYQYQENLDFKGLLPENLVAPTVDVYANGTLIVAEIEAERRGNQWYFDSNNITELAQANDMNEVSFVVKDEGEIVGVEDKEYFSITQMTDKKVLIEEFSGTWCPWCVQGDVVMDSILEAHEEDFIRVGVRWADVMTVAGGDTIAGVYANGSPSAAFNRKKFNDQFNVGVPWQDWPAKANHNFGSISPFELTIDQDYNFETGQVDINVQTKALGNFSGDYRVSVYVVQDVVIETENSEYWQVNGFNEVEGHPYFGAGENIVGYPFPDVVKAILGGPFGQAGSIPENTQNQQIYTTSFTYQMPDGLSDEPFTLVAMVHEFTDFMFDRPILNATSTTLQNTVPTEPTVEPVTPADTTDMPIDTTDMPIDTTDMPIDTTTTTSITNTPINTKINVYPNPINDFLFVEINALDTKKASVYLYDLQGKAIKELLPTQNINQTLTTKFNLSPLSEGVYLLKIQLDGVSYWEKVVIE